MMEVHELGPRLAEALTAVHYGADGLDECRRFVGDVGPTDAAFTLFALCQMLLAHATDGREFLAHWGLQMAKMNAER